MNSYFAFFTLYIVCFTFFQISFANEVCDKSSCKGPLKYYEELKCKPIYESPDDCCPHRYNCDHLKDRSPKKCYVNGHEYNIGEVIDKKDSGGRSDYQCSCTENRNGIATAACAVADYFHPPLPRPDCYYVQNRESASIQIICPDRLEKQVTCEVDGNIYRDGEQFSPASDPSQTCYCSSGYTGENIAPYCSAPIDTCLTEFYYSADIYQKCAPVKSYLPFTNCTTEFRCQTPEDYIIKQSDSDNDMTCEFGNLTLNYGDKLNRVSVLSHCLKCVCEVGPAVTCNYLPESECNN